MNVVIVAGGLGSRLAPITNHIPKFLVNIGKQTGYVEQVRYWLQYGTFEPIDTALDLSPEVISECTDTLTVIVHSAYKSLIAEYHKLYFPKIPLIVKTVDEANGSAHAILTSCEHLIGKRVFFQWCDVMPADTFAVDEIGSVGAANVCFTNYDHPNRYGLVHSGTGHAYVKPELMTNGRGGVFGLYYISQYRSADIQYKNGDDFVDVLMQFGKLCEYKLERIVDWGDKPKLERTRATADAAREFNKVEFSGDLVIKSALNAQGEELIGREIRWYEALNRAHAAERGLNIPQTWISTDQKSFVMSRVKGVPVFQLWGTLDADGRQLVLSRVIEQLKKLHGIEFTGSHDRLAADIKLEAHDKLITRYREIRGVIDAFGQVSVVNGTRLLEADPERTITRLFEKLISKYSADGTYCTIHGDLQLSNTMIDPDTLEVSIIDPRGYFGKTMIGGLADYDISKLLYSLSGYDQFNYSSTFSLARNETELSFDIQQPNLVGCEAIMKNTFTEVHQLWLAVIWIGLAQYIKNDPVKSIAAHYHGLAMAERLLKA